MTRTWSVAAKVCHWAKSRDFGPQAESGPPPQKRGLVGTDPIAWIHNVIWKMAASVRDTGWLALGQCCQIWYTWAALRQFQMCDNLRLPCKKISEMCEARPAADANVLVSSEPAGAEKQDFLEPVDASGAFARFDREQIIAGVEHPARPRLNLSRPP